MNPMFPVLLWGVFAAVGLFIGAIEGYADASWRKFFAFFLPLAILGPFTVVLALGILLGLIYDSVRESHREARAKKSSVR